MLTRTAPIIITAVVAVPAVCLCQERTVGLFLNDEGASPGYTLIAPHQHPSTYLVDLEGMVVNQWMHEFNIGSTTQLLQNGNLLRASRAPNSWTTGGGRGGRIEEIAWDGEIVWQFDHVSDQYTLHHDVVAMPGGTILATVWERRDEAALLAAGYNPANLADAEVFEFWTEKIIEFKPVSTDRAEIVWQWDAWDHLVQNFDESKANFGNPSRKPDRIDINSGDGGDWLHINGIDYDEELDIIALSVSFFSEVWIIDHSTTVEEAKGSRGGNFNQGGDLLYRFGNPAMYGIGGPESQTLFFNHSPLWIDAGLPGGGHLTVFDNGRDRPDMQYSTVYELRLPYTEDYDGQVYFNINVDGTFAEPEIVWSYTNPGTFYSNFISGQQRLPNGNTLIAEGMTGRIFEIMDDRKVWEYVNPVVRTGPLEQGTPIPPFSQGNERLQTAVYRSYRYAPDYPGLRDKDLTPMGTIELVSSAVDKDLPSQWVLEQNYPNPFNPSTTIRFSVPEATPVLLTVFNLLGQHVATLYDGWKTAGTHSLAFDATGKGSGVYTYRLQTGSHSATRSMLLSR